MRKVAERLAERLRSLRGGPRRAFSLLALAVWAVMCLVLASSLAVAHTVTLPRPATQDAQLQQAVRLARPGAARGVFALHVLYGSCRCSERILDHLRARGPSADAEELIALVGPRAGQVERLTARHFRVLTLTPRELAARFSVRTAPLLVVADEAHTLRYVGGYTARKQGSDPIDARVISAVSRGQTLRELPLFGCAVSRSLQRMLDPLGLKYGFQDGAS